MTKILEFLVSIPTAIWAALTFFVIGMATDISERWGVGSEHNRVWGADLASAATIAPTHMFHRVTGTTQIDTITPPYPTFSGMLVLSFAGACVVSAAGNVDIAFTSAANEFAVLIYNPARAKWSGALVNAIT
jgi:hypothetical protein